MRSFWVRLRWNGYSIEFVKKAQSVGVDATLFSMPGIWHGVVQEMDMPEADEARHRIAEFIKTHLALK